MSRLQISFLSVGFVLFTVFGLFVGDVMAIPGEICDLNSAGPACPNGCTVYDPDDGSPQPCLTIGQLHDCKDRDNETCSLPVCGGVNQTTFGDCSCDGGSGCS
jgi:hypothetical protein